MRHILQQIIYTGVGVLGCISFLVGLIVALHKSKHIKFDVFAFVKNLLYKEIQEDVNRRAGLLEESIDSLHEKYNEQQYENDKREQEDLRFKILLYRKMQISNVPLTEFDILNENAMYDRYKTIGGNSYIEKIHKQINDIDN